MTLCPDRPLIVRPFSRVCEDSQEVRALSERLHAQADRVVAKSRALRAVLVAGEAWSAGSVEVLALGEPR